MTDLVTGLSRQEMQELGRNVRRARITAGMTQGRLAVAVGLTERSVRRVERGEVGVRISRLFSIAKVLRVSLDRLLPVATGASEQGHGPTQARTRPSPAEIISRLTSQADDSGTSRA